MEGTYHKKLDEAMNQYITQLGTGKDLGPAMEEAYNNLTAAIRHDELTPWQKESHARNLELLAEEHNRITNNQYWKGTLPHRKLKKEIDKTKQVISKCQQIQEEAIKEANETIRCKKHTY